MRHFNNSSECKVIFKKYCECIAARCLNCSTIRCRCAML
ncbi:hypothetical protein P262_02699 [Cronobacter malonaticus]|uniref:Uncharacterized protein n=1 Tax=Cronobacter malonaticus TaxID=413503 RepID=V5TYC7_9ENTR|nr:hypothetical protein P262_02699 [Cronobacter malonaticus]